MRSLNVEANIYASLSHLVSFIFIRHNYLEAAASLRHMKRFKRLKAAGCYWSRYWI